MYGSDGARGPFRNSNYINNQIQIIESDEVLRNILLDKKIKAKEEEEESRSNSHSQAKRLVKTTESSNKMSE